MWMPCNLIVAKAPLKGVCTTLLGCVFFWLTRHYTSCLFFSCRRPKALGMGQAFASFPYRCLEVGVFGLRRIHNNSVAARDKGISSMKSLRDWRAIRPKLEKLAATSTRKKTLHKGKHTRYKNVEVRRRVWITDRREPAFRVL